MVTSKSREPRGTIFGIPLGESGDPRSPVVQRMLELGVNISSLSVPDLRRGDSNPKRLRRWVLAARALDEDNASVKNQRYLEIAKKGIDPQIREYQAKRHDRFRSVGYTDKIAATLEGQPSEIQESIRAIRAEVVIEDSLKVNPQLRRSFQFSVNEFLSAYGRSSRSPSAIVERLQDFWRDGSLLSFYSIIYEGANRTIAVLTPYEMDFILDFYKRRIHEGNRLSLFDRILLESMRDKVDIRALATQLSKQTGVELDRDVLNRHINVLLS